MKTGNELGVSPYKFENKNSTDKLTKIIYEVNDIMYKYARRPISPKAQVRLMELVKAKGTEAKALEVPDTARAKKEELLTNLRNTYRKLEAYDEVSDPEQVQKLINYTVAMLVKEQKENEHNWTAERITDILKDIKDIFNDYVVGLDHPLNLSAIRKFHSDLLEAYGRILALP